MIRPFKARSLLLTSICAGALSLALAPSENGQIEAALVQQRSLVAAHPTPTNLNDLANLLVVQGELEEAAEVYSRALEIEPSHIEVSYNFALLLQHQGDHKAALKLFRQVVERVPDAAWAHLQIGVISSDLGKRRAAISAFSTAFALEPRLASPAVNPHLLDRPEVLEAMLRAPTEPSVSQTAPLSFSEPDRIARLLIGESAAGQAAARAIAQRGLVEPERSDGTMVDTPSQRRREISSLPASARSGADEPRLPVDTEEVYAEEDPTETYPAPTGRKDEELASPDARGEQTEGSTQAGSAARRVVGAEDLRPVRGAGATGSSAGSRVTPPPSPPKRVTPPSTTRPSGSRGRGASRFRPGVRSSARLELHTEPSRSSAVSRWVPLAPAKSVD